MRREEINDEKRKEMEKRLGCRFCSDGLFAEMSVDLASYEEKTQPIPDVEYGFHQGNVEDVRKAVALVDEKWVQYFREDSLREDSLIFCGYRDGQIVSFCTVETDADCILSIPGVRTGSIGCVGTVPRYRKMGIGLRMVDLATVYVKNQGCHKGYIHYTHIDKWYAKLGYRTFARFSFQI